MKTQSNMVAALALMLVGLTPAMGQDASSEEDKDRIQDEIEAMELEAHRLRTEKMLIALRQEIADERLELLEKERLIANGGVEVAKETVPAAPVQALPQFDWGELPRLRSIGQDSEGRTASLQYDNGQRVVAHVGDQLQGGIQVLDITDEGLKIGKQGRERWVR